jgi:hypothetical protein
MVPKSELQFHSNVEIKTKIEILISTSKSKFRFKHQNFDEIMMKFCGNFNFDIDIEIKIPENGNIETKLGQNFVQILILSKEKKITFVETLFIFQ